jgi:Flp pilus assembly protein TadG
MALAPLSSTARLCAGMTQENTMTAASTPASLFKRFTADQKGNVAIMLGLAIVPFIMAAGAAIDYGRYNGAQTHVQSALDAAALAGASGATVSDAARLQAVKLSFEHNMQNGAAAGMDVKPDFDIVDGRIIASAELVMPTSFMAVAGFSDLEGKFSAEVGIQIDKKAEVALVLDYSGSMWETAGSNVKYVAMKDAATNLVNDLAAADPDKVKFGLVPFSHHVYTTLPGAYVLGGGPSMWTGCTQDRQSPFNVSDSTPTTDDDSKWNQPMYADPDQLAYDCSGYIGNSLKTVDLTDDFAKVTHQLSIMKPYAYTHIALGVEFGYHMLSPNAPFTQGAAYNDKGTKKFMVVLTDGMQTAGAFGPKGKRNPAQGNANLEKLCTSAKANGITIITMAFDLDDSATRKRLQNCATDADRDFFVVDDSADLANAFETVKSAITAQVYISK